MMKALYLVITLLLISGCSAFNPLSLLDDGPKLEIKTNIGKTVKSEDSTLKIETGKTEQVADKIENGKQEANLIENITQEMPPWMFLVIIGLAGVAIDGKGAIKSVREDIRGVVKFPFNFILMLFGRDKL